MRSLLVTIALLLAGAMAFAHDLPTTRPTNMKIMSFNIRTATASDGANSWPNRQELLFKTIRAYCPDLLGIQEVVQIQLDAATQALADFDHVGVAREDGKAKGEYAPVFFRRDRFDLVETGTWWLSPTPEKIASVGWDAALTRIATWARLRDKASDEAIFVVNTHFDHVGQIARRESAKLLREKLKNEAGKIILMGDFNSTDLDDPIKEIVAGDVFIDTYRKLHPEPTDTESTFHAFTGQVEGKRIDFIFTKGFEVTEAGIDRTRAGTRSPSDHDAATATVR